VRGRFVYVKMCPLPAQFYSSLDIHHLNDPLAVHEASRTAMESLVGPMVMIRCVYVFVEVGDERDVQPALLTVVERERMCRSRTSR
jgi:hypothetical protein